LCGAQTEKIVANGHNRLRLFGSGSARKKDEWRALIRQLVAARFLVHDVAGYGGLSLSDDGGALLRGEGQFLYRQDAARIRKDRTPAPSAAITSDQQALLAALKRLRLQIAAQRHLPAYLIFSDKTLLEMARSAPRNLSEFALVNGVGNSKLRDFGQIFVDAITAHRAG
jgi:ATP-dependent DNA helicase RecQ